MTHWLQLLGGGALLYFGAEWFVGGASALALSLRVPQIIVGLTVIAYGASAPEAIVGVDAAASGHGEVALSNVLGSNIANIGLIVGISALIRPARVDGALRRRELPILVLSAALVPLVLLDGRVSWGEGAGLVAFAVAYTGWMVFAARSDAAHRVASDEAMETISIADAAGAPKPRGAVGSAVTLCIGLLVLLLGGHLFVEGAVRVARQLGMSDRVVGLTIVAIGTSLPELVASAIASSRGHSDIAIGNVVGPNIFNVLLCLGLAAMTGAVGVPLAQIRTDVAMFALMTLLAAVFIRSERTVARREGAVALGLYVAFNVYVIASA